MKEKWEDFKDWFYYYNEIFTYIIMIVIIIVLSFGAYIMFDPGANRTERTINMNEIEQLKIEIMETKIMKIKNVNGNYYYINDNNEDYEMIKSIWVDFELDVFMLNTEHWIYNIDTNSKNGKYIQIYFDIDLNELYKKISYCSLIKLNI